MTVSVAAEETAEPPPEAAVVNATALRDAFTTPLQQELLMSGFSAANAEKAAEKLLDSLVECWNSDRNEAASRLQTIAVRMGGQLVVTYDTPCMDEFLADVEEIVNQRR